MQALRRRKMGGRVSYSVCLKCKAMVTMYEKYCTDCERKAGKNDSNFWRKNGYEYFEEPKRTEELRKDGMHQKKIGEL